MEQKKKSSLQTMTLEEKLELISAMMSLPEKTIQNITEKNKNLSTEEWQKDLIQAYRNNQQPQT